MRREAASRGLKIEAVHPIPKRLDQSYRVIEIQLRKWKPRRKIEDVSDSQLAPSGTSSTVGSLIDELISI
jgi:hypothetical protein